MASITAIRGFKDILPEETHLWRRMEATLTRVLSAFGYREIRIPVLERTELFARGIGTDTDIVEKEMYTFPDRHGESLTMRPEATASITRAVAEHGLAGDGRPLKLWFMGPMFRYERPQKGRQRQFHQVDVEVFNDPSPHVDAELVVLLTQILHELGLRRLTVHLNSLGCPDCRPDFKAKLRDYLAARRPELCPDCQRRFETNPLRVVDCKVERCAELVKDAPSIQESLCPDCRDHFAAVKKMIDETGLQAISDPRLVRGLDYYYRTTFEVHSGDLGAQNAVAGGGRYDGLSKAIGGPDLSGTGFAVGLERLIMLLSELEQPQAPGPELFVAALDAAAAAASFGLVQGLRRRGVWAEMEYQPGSLKSKMKRADKLGAARVLILGPDEMARGLAILRDMKSKEQKELPLDEIQGRLLDIIGKGERN
ncbi:MAG: histidine--tRNA ligase [Pseudomonadota bacterium]